MQKLHRASIVESLQGPFGGYALSRLPVEITLLEIVEAVQGPIAVNLCFCNPSTCNKTTCSLKRHMTSLQAKVNEWLEGVTLGDIIEDLSQVQGAGFHGQAAASLKPKSSKGRWPSRDRNSQPLRKA
jgi:DNA-binding IscR family transcriptional regulator